MFYPIPSDISLTVRQAFEQLKERETGYLQLKHIYDRYYVHRSTSIWNKEKKEHKKVSEPLGAITMDGEFEPISARTDVPITDREVFEYANGKLAYYLLEKKEVYSQIPKKTREIIALFPQALPMG